MAHYAYKVFCYDIDYDTFSKYCDIYEKAHGYQPTDASSDGDFWIVAAMWMEDVLEENKKLKEEIFNLTK